VEAQRTCISASATGGIRNNYIDPWPLLKNDMSLFLLDSDKDSLEARAEMGGVYENGRFKLVEEPDLLPGNFWVQLNLVIPKFTNSLGIKSPINWLVLTKSKADTMELTVDRIPAASGTDLMR